MANKERQNEIDLVNELRKKGIKVSIGKKDVTNQVVNNQSIVDKSKNTESTESIEPTKIDSTDTVKIGHIDSLADLEHGIMSQAESQELAEGEEEINAATDDDDFSDLDSDNDNFTDQDEPDDTPKTQKLSLNTANIGKEITGNNITDLLIEIYDTVDQTKRLKSIRDTGDFQESLNKVLKPYLANGYIVQGTLPVAPENNEAQVNLAHKTKTVTRTKKVTQTIQYFTADDSKAPDDVVRELIFNQNGVKDLVTNKITWSNEPTTQSFTKIPSPVRRGYIADPEYVPEQEITVDNDNFDISLNKKWIVNYVAEVLTIKVQIIDDDYNDSIIEEYPLTGHDGYMVQIDINNIAAGLKKDHLIVSESNLPQKIVFESGKAPIYEIHVVHERCQLHDDTSLETIGIYKIKLVDKYSNELSKPIILEQHYTRTGQKDLVTDKITYSKWKKRGVLPKVQATPKKLTNAAGETLIPMSSQVEIPEVLPSNTQTVEQRYYAPKQIVTIEYYCNKKKVNNIKDSLGFALNEQEVIYLSQLEEHIKKEGYTIIPGQQIPKSFSYDSTKPDKRSYQVNLQEIKTKTEEHKVVKRFIHITMPNGIKRSITETAQLTRPVIINESKPKNDPTRKEYGEWDHNMWDEIDMPKLGGYTCNQSKIPSVFIDDTTSDTKVSIFYVQKRNQPKDADDKSADLSHEIADETEKPKSLFQRVKAFLLPGKAEKSDQLALEAPKSKQKNK